MKKDEPLAVGDTVKLRGVVGPKMVIGTTHQDGKTHDCAWFDSDGHLNTAVFNERVLERSK